jgi:hypothetical protein
MMTELRTEPHEEEELSTADMAAASARPIPEQDKIRKESVRPGEQKPQPQATAGAAPAHPTPLFHEPDAQEMRARWDAIQTAFVDNPRQAVEQADHLVAQTIKRLADMFAQERSQLEQQWSRGGDVSTEDLRIALQRYRSFFGRLLSL